MNLKEINPKAYAMWDAIDKKNPKFFKESSSEELHKIEILMGAKLPNIYKEFMLEYHMLPAIPRIGAYCFKADYKAGSIIDFSMTLIPPASSTIDAIEDLADRNEAPVIPEGLMPLTYSDYSTLLIDLRRDTYGYIWNIFEIKRQTFGSLGYDWDDVGFVAKSLTEFIAGLDTEEALIEKYGLPSRG